MFADSFLLMNAGFFSKNTALNRTHTHIKKVNLPGVDVIKCITKMENECIPCQKNVIFCHLITSLKLTGNFIKVVKLTLKGN